MNFTNDLDQLQKLNLVLDSHAIVSVADVNGNIIYANDKFCEINELSREDLIGKNHNIVASGYHSKQFFEDLWDTITNGKVWHGEICNRSYLGKIYWVAATIMPFLDEHGLPYQYISIRTDITKQKEYEKGILEAKLAAEKSSQASSSFLANMSHEIRTPMNAIIGFTDILLKTDVNQQQLKHLSTIQHSAKSLLHLINDILDISKLENKDNMSMLNETFSLRSVCLNVIETLRISAKKQNIELNLIYPNDFYDYWIGDQYRLQQILINLVGNAIKFTHEGEVNLSVNGSSKNLKIEISDTGIGIDKETLKNIFNPFAQADASTTRRYGGTGLGTTISKQITELMGGSLTATSKLGVGSVFTVNLPLQVSTESNALDINTLQNIECKIPNLKILAVDDIATNTELLEIILTDQGHTVTSVSSGQQAIDILQKQSFDLIFMDIQMPDMDGLETTKIIRGIEIKNNGKPIPIIALSASVLPQDKHQAYEAGMNGFANKPIELDALFGEIAKVLNIEEIISKSKNIEPIPTQYKNEIINYESALKLWRKPENLYKAIERFLINATVDMQDLNTAYAINDKEKMIAIGHKISGAASNLGLIKVRRWASTLEKDVKQNSLKDLGYTIKNLENVITEALQYISNKVGLDVAFNNSAKDLVKMTDQQFIKVKNALNKLTESVKNCEILEDELSLLKKYINAKCVVELEDSLENFDFDLAGKHLIEINNCLLGAHQNKTN